MGWLRGSRPKDADALCEALKFGTYEDAMAHYDPAWVDFERNGQNLLAIALTNKDPDARVRIANRLLDDGASVDVGGPLHLLLSKRSHDYEREPALLARMIEAGADVNQVIGREGAPIESLVRIPSLSDSDLKPFYDVFFAQPDLDLEQDGGLGKPIIEGFRAKGEKREVLTRRAEAYIDEHSSKE